MVLPLLSSGLLAALSLLVVYILRPLFHLVRSLCLSPLARLPSPPSPSFLLGNLAAIADQENNDVLSAWTRIYGSTFTYRGFIGGRRLLTTDPLALNHILGHAYDFPKPEFVRASLSAMVAGDGGLLTVEGDVHRRQRKTLNQAFTVPHIKSLFPIFIDKATELRDVLSRNFDTPNPPASPPPPLSPKSAHAALPDSFAILRSLDPVRPKQGSAAAATNGAAAQSSPGVVVDMLSYLSHATLDVIGEAGFGYRFKALSSQAPGDDTEPENELSAAFAVIFATARKFRVLSVFQSWFPILRRYQPNGASIRDAQATIRRVGSHLITERRASLSTTDTPSLPTNGSGAASEPRDLLSVLVRANTKGGEDVLSHNELLSQISTFLAAGHETTASALTWTLYALARSPEEQTILRDALLALPEDAPTDTLLGLPELDRVVREALRLHAPVGSTMRVYAGEDLETVIPLARGVRLREPSTLPIWRIPAACALLIALKAFFGWAWAIVSWSCIITLIVRARLTLSRPDDVDSEACDRGTARADDGEWTTANHIRLRRGDIITIPIQAVNRDPLVWGDDAREFRPSRWLHLPAPGVSASGLYPHTLTFLNGSPINGNRACIGYRFAIAEIKIFLCVLLRALEFSIDDGVVIEKRVNVVTRPFVASAPELGNQMPLRVRRVSA